MNYPPLEEVKYELIKAHFLDPDNSPLPVPYQEQLSRLISITQLLDRYPNTRNALLIHRQKYPDICEKTAYNDIKLAARLFPTVHTFDWDFWQTWLMNDISKNIIACSLTRSERDRKIIAMEHANLSRMIASRPNEQADIRRNEKQEFCFLIQNNNHSAKLTPEQIKDLPVATLRDIHKLLYSGNEITDIEAEEIMNS